MFVTVIIQDLIQFIYCHSHILSHIWALFLVLSFLITCFLFSKHSQHIKISLSGAQPGAILHPPTPARDIWQCLEIIWCHNLGQRVVLLAFCGYRPGMRLNITQYTG